MKPCFQTPTRSCRRICPVVLQVQTTYSHSWNRCLNLKKNLAAHKRLTVDCNSPQARRWWRCTSGFWWRFLGTFLHISLGSRAKRFWPSAPSSSDIYEPGSRSSWKQRRRRCAWTSSAVRKHSNRSEVTRWAQAAGSWWTKLKTFSFSWNRSRTASGVWDIHRAERFYRYRDIYIYRYFVSR